jgi:AraC-like DNA-binding protein
MYYRTHVPKPPINQFIDYLWQFDGGQLPRRERIVPSGTMELVINLREDRVSVENEKNQKRLSGAVVSGTYSSIFVIDAMQHESMLGVHFKPAGAFPFLGVAANELTNAHIDLVDLWGSVARELRERVCLASTQEQRFEIVEEVLTYRLRSAPKRNAAVDISLDAFGPYGTSSNVQEVAKETGICQRRFRKVFAHEVGLTPKVFSRILRFQRARSLTDTIVKPDWADIALACGYFDQSHLIHDFHEFSGLSPTEYLALRKHQPDGRLKTNHVPLFKRSLFSNTKLDPQLTLKKKRKDVCEPNTVGR